MTNYSGFYQKQHFSDKKTFFLDFWDVEIYEIFEIYFKDFFRDFKIFLGFLRFLRVFLSFEILRFIYQSFFRVICPSKKSLPAVAPATAPAPPPVINEHSFSHLHITSDSWNVLHLSYPIIITKKHNSIANYAHKEDICIPYVKSLHTWNIHEIFSSYINVRYRGGGGGSKNNVQCTLSVAVVLFWVSPYHYFPCPYEIIILVNHFRQKCIFRNNS